MVEITIQESTFERLQKHARPFDDTPDSVLNRALDALDKISVPAAPVGTWGTVNERRINPRQLPNLRHTKVLDASIGGEPIAKPNWNRLVENILRMGMNRLGSFEKLRQIISVNMVQGRKDDKGYSYLSDIDISVQGLDSNTACRTIVMAAEYLGITLDIGFMWRPKEGADHPGKRARLQIG